MNTTEVSVLTQTSLEDHHTILTAKNKRSLIKQTQTEDNGLPSCRHRNHMTTRGKARELLFFFFLVLKRTQS